MVSEQMKKKIGGSGMNIKEILECVDNAIMELECVNFEDIPDDLQEKFIQVHMLMSHISIALEKKI